MNKKAKIATKPIFLICCLTNSQISLCFVHYQIKHTINIGIKLRQKETTMTQIESVTFTRKDQSSMKRSN